jgi:group II intron reverse transcriptase/maturase
METSNSELVSPRQRRIAELAKQNPEMGFISLNHHLDLPWLLEAYARTRKDGAVGVDGQTAAEYAANLEANLRMLLNRAKSGLYRAPPVRRVYIPKGQGDEMRPIGMPTFEDKILQRAIVMLLEPIYEQDFYNCSYGFRPGRSAHQALDALWKGLMGMGGGWVLDVDIRKFFDTVDHGHLRDFVQQRIRDGMVRRLIGKWLNAGVMEEGAVWHPETGTPQGGVISPLLANIYLNCVMDGWFEQEVKPRLRGRAFMIRYADDLVMVFSDLKDAHRVLEVLPKRLGRFGLSLHPEKTRLVEFRRPALYPAKGRPGPGTFNLLGFTHMWARSRRGHWVVRRKTAKDRIARTLRKVSEWCRRHRHLPIAEQREALSQQLRGHCAYYGITWNSPALSSVRYAMLCIWRYWLRRRNRERQMSWERFLQLLERHPLPAVTLPHSVCRRGSEAVT